MSDKTDSSVFRSVVMGRWCPITQHFLHDDGVLGFQHHTEFVPQPVRCPLDWSEHPQAERITEIRLTKKCSIAVHKLEIVENPAYVVPDAVAASDGEVSCSCGALTIGPISSTIPGASVQARCSHCGDTIEATDNHDG